MRALFTAPGSPGHVHPVVPIARVAAHAPFVPNVERSGYRASPAGIAQTVAEAFPEVRALRGGDEPWSGMTILPDGRSTRRGHDRPHDQDLGCRPGDAGAPPGLALAS